MNYKPKSSDLVKAGSSLLPHNYLQVLEALKDRIRQARLKATLSAHRHLIELYWHVGKVIMERQRNEGWGKSVVERLAQDLRKAFPDMAGFSPRNIWRMRSFYLAYTEDIKKLPQPAAEFDGVNCRNPRQKYLGFITGNQSSDKRPKWFWPRIQGFSAQNLWNMRQLYLSYRENPKLQPLVGEISWTKNVIIMQHCKK